MSQKKKTFSKVTAVKDAARETVGTPKATQAIPDAKTKAQRRTTKHKQKLQDLLQDSAEN